MRCRSVREWLRELTLYPTPRKISDYLRGELVSLDGEPDAAGESPRRRHLRRCAACRAHVRRALQYWSLLALFCRDVTPSAGFESRVAARMRAEGVLRGPANGGNGHGEDPLLEALAGARRAAWLPQGRIEAETSLEERQLYREATGANAVVGWLLELSGPFAGRDRPLGPGENLVGTDPRCAIVLPGDAGVAPRHASIICAASEAGLSCFVLDHASPGGTFVNGGEDRISWARLEDGDTLRLGEARLKFKALSGVPAA